MVVETQKTLSTGTLNLRFMQNTRRAQQLSGVDVELEKAHVKDEAEWEVAPEIRKAWGLVDGARSNSDSNDDLYERSYMPFLFPSVSETAGVGEGNGIASSSTSLSGVQPHGRRKFNKNGEESSKPPEVRSAVAAVADVQPDETRKIKIKSISSSTNSILSAKPSKKLKDPASRVIYDNSNVGVDLRSGSLSSNRTSAPKSANTSGSNAFMKPAGVDDPSPSSRDAPSSPASTSFARKGKRRQEQDNAEVETTGLKKKKTLSFVE
ncbi:hypothetical protein DFJ58DRAFT_703960 [Suillus subalutaceus]|uniref:uncharacterized protein n=1 Tax=Suillus subalutaceus TaxID=48586 RepID=UPI001B85F004|nr:uncharacterized protein DFJ58DRAFT_703960 [Suillus subalutaceus]KAG1852121.1 hypothetical protein DFJ58DRAFT_703960 [Suillus subalutaceus]